jgi:hypothetical protein
MYRQFARLSPLLALLGLAGTTMGQNVIVNGDFETGDFTGWTVMNTANGVGAPGTVELVDIDGPGPLTDSLAAKFYVGQAVFMSGAQEGVELSQTVNLQSGTDYTFDMDWAALRVSSTNNAEGGVFTVLIDGVQMAQGAAGSTSSAFPKYGHINFIHTAAATGPATVTIRITRPFTSPGDLSQHVDNVTFTGTGGPVPCYANCDGSTTEPILNVADFTCFLSKFAAGC